MPRRVWIHESNIVPATIVPEQTLVVEAQAFIDHTAELALYKRDNSSLKKQHKKDTKKVKTLEQQVKELTEERDDLKRMFQGTLQREQKYKESLDMTMKKAQNVYQDIKHYEEQLDALVKLEYIRPYDKLTEGGKIRRDIMINTISNSNDDEYTITNLRDELQKMEKKIMIQEGVIKSLQGKKVEPIHKKCKKVGEGYKQQDKEEELARQLYKLGSGEGIQVGKSMVFNATDGELSEGNIQLVKKLMEKYGGK